MTDMEETKNPLRKILGINLLEFVAGGIVIILGVGVVYEGFNYPMGSLRNVGPGIFPLLLGVVLSALGCAIIAEGRNSIAAVPKVPWRAILAISAALGSFAFSIERMGAFVSIFALIFISGLAEREFRPVALLLTSLALCAFTAALVFGFEGIVNMRLLPGD